MDMLEYAKSFIGTNYKWGGKTKESGYDCSGFVSEVIKSEGLLPNNAIMSSQMLYDYLSSSQNIQIGNSLIGAESILFFGESTEKIKHVAIAFNKDKMIEAGGEGRIDTDKGMVRVRRISNRNDLVASLNFNNDI